MLNEQLRVMQTIEVKFCDSSSEAFQRFKRNKNACQKYKLLCLESFSLHIFEPNSAIQNLTIFDF